jgi:hypothetical protein
MPKLTDDLKQARTSANSYCNTREAKVTRARIVVMLKESASQANVDCEALMAFWLRFTTERNHAPGMLHFEIARTATSEQLPGTAFSTVVVSMAWK